jgi:uncharacterized RDD family membrane protein YckC
MNKPEQRQYPLDQIPLLGRRYAATAIDGFLLIFLVVIAIQIPGDSSISLNARRILIFLPFFIYEPVLTSYAFTFGQLVMRVRVRKFHDPSRKISILAAYARWFLKIFLGAPSFLAAFFSRNRLTLHDRFASSIVLKADSYLLQAESE